MAVMRFCNMFITLVCALQTVMNDALMGILRVKDLSSPPYLTITPSVNRLQVQPEDKFVVIGSDGLFDFFTNEEVVEYVDSFLIAQPTGDPAKYMVEQLLLRAANFAGTNINDPLLPTERELAVLR